LKESLDSEQYDHINFIPYHILFDDFPNDYHRVATYFYPEDSVLKSQLDDIIKSEGFFFTVGHGTNPPSKFYYDVSSMMLDYLPCACCLLVASKKIM
jgi:hypothetical protein